jgi:cardiolipin synthase
MRASGLNRSSNVGRQRMDRTAASRHEVHVYPEMAPFLDDVLRDIDKARRRIFVENYIVKADRMGEALLRRLEAAVGRGVEARLLCDASGSHSLTGTRVARLCGRGVAVRRFGMMPMLGFFRPGFRNHARLVLIDDVAYTGGHAWARQWLPRDRGGGGWSDVNCRVRGPICDLWGSLYLRRWDESRRICPGSLDTGQVYPEVRLVSDGPGLPHRVAEVYMEAFRQARRRIWIGNAYFFPTQRFLSELFEARARGIDVQIVVPGTSDLALVARAARASYRTWVDHGLAIYQLDGTMMHAKYALVDHDWVTIGSFNALGAAMAYAVETNLFVRDAGAAASVAQHFRRQVARSVRVTAERLQSRRLRTRLLDDLARVTMLLFAWALERIGELARWAGRARIWGADQRG